jgi:uncharacterized protein (UPF0335 family)
MGTGVVSVYHGIRTRAAIDQIEQVPQRQDSLADQIRDVIVAASKLGCYDAADWVRAQLPENHREAPR